MNKDLEAKALAALIHTEGNWYKDRDFLEIKSSNANPICSFYINNEFSMNYVLAASPSKILYLLNQHKRDQKKIKMLTEALKMADATLEKCQNLVPNNLMNTESFGHIFVPPVRSLISCALEESELENK